MAELVSDASTAMSRIAARAFKDTKSAALTLGVGTVIATHTVMILLPPEDNSGSFNHSVINLAAGAAIVYGSGILG
jgi:hypothetical protein